MTESVSGGRMWTTVFGIVVSALLSVQVYIGSHLVQVVDEMRAELSSLNQRVSVLEERTRPAGRRP